MGFINQQTSLGGHTLCTWCSWNNALQLPLLPSADRLRRSWRSFSCCSSNSASPWNLLEPLVWHTNRQEPVKTACMFTQFHSHAILVRFRFTAKKNRAFLEAGHTSIIHKPLIMADSKVSIRLLVPSYWAPLRKQVFFGFVWDLPNLHAFRAITIGPFNRGGWVTMGPSPLSGGACPWGLATPTADPCKKQWDKVIRKWSSYLVCGGRH